MIQPERVLVAKSAFCMMTWAVSPSWAVGTRIGVSPVLWVLVEGRQLKNVDGVDGRKREALQGRHQ